MTIGDNRDYIRVLLYSYCTTITGWGVLPRLVLGRVSEFGGGGRPVWFARPGESQEANGPQAEFFCLEVRA